MKRVHILTIVLMAAACKPDRKVCEFTSDNEELVIYNNILTDLIENHMHGKYLGGKEEEIREKYYYEKEKVDTARIDEEFIAAHNAIFNHPSRFCSLYLDTLSRQEFFYDSIRYEQDVAFMSLISKYTTNPRAAVDSLNSLQQRYSPGDFGLCTARLDRLEDWRNDSVCSFGRIRLSKIVLNNNKDKGMMFYAWHCGSIGLCGHSGIIEFIRETKHWKITGFKYWSVY